MEADIPNQIEGLQPVKERGVTHYPYILFNKSPEQLRRLGACGGKANARNQRARRALVLTPLPPATPRPVPGETATQAITVLDAQFPGCAVPKNVFPATKRPLEFSSRSRQPKGNERQPKATKSNHGDLNQVLPFLPKHRWEHLGSHSWHSSSLDSVAPRDSNR